MKIKSAFKEYSVDFCRDLSLLQDLAAAKDTFFVRDRTVYEIYKDRLPDLPKERFFLLEAIEEKKRDGPQRSERRDKHFIKGEK